MTYENCVNPGSLPHAYPSLCPSRAKEQQKEADDFGLSTRYEEDAQRHHTAFALPCPRLSGHRPPPVAEPARELKPVMEKEMKRAEEARGNAGLVSTMVFVDKSASMSVCDSRVRTLPLTNKLKKY